MEIYGEKWRRAVVKNWWEAIINMLFPGSHLCSLCWREIQGQKGSGVCDGCREEILGLSGEGKSCRCCGHFTPAANCPNCHDWYGNNLVRAMGVVPYRGIYRELIHTLKYSGREDLARPMGYLMAERFRKEVLVPAPGYPRTPPPGKGKRKGL